MSDFPFLLEQKLLGSFNMAYEAPHCLVPASLLTYGKALLPVTVHILARQPLFSHSPSYLRDLLHALSA